MATWPLESPRFGRAFGWRTHPVTGRRQHHNGQDFPNDTGSPLLAVEDGEVYTSLTTAQNPWGGNFVGIRFADGSRARYFHMQSRSPLNVGDRVKMGQQVGKLGNTGKGTTGPHLHFELLDHKGVAVDPRQWIAARLTTKLDTPKTPTPGAGTSNEENEMAPIAAQAKGKSPIYIVGGGFKRRIQSRNELEAFAGIMDAAGVPFSSEPVVMSEWALEVLLRAHTGELSVSQ